jgi:hypothetical protein
MARIRTFLTLTILIAGLATLTACDDLPMTGEWEVELPDAEACTIELEIFQDEDDLEGVAELDCTIYVETGNEIFEPYTLRFDDLEVDGEIDGEDFEIEIEFDAAILGRLEFVLSGEVDGDELEGEVELNGLYFGEFEGERD